MVVHCKCIDIMRNYWPIWRKPKVELFYGNRLYMQNSNTGVLFHWLHTNSGYAGLILRIWISHYFTDMHLLRHLALYMWLIMTKWFEIYLDPSHLIGVIYKINLYNHTIQLSTISCATVLLTRLLWSPRIANCRPITKEGDFYHLPKIIL